MSFNILIDKEKVFVNNGMSTEICFTKMIASKLNKVYYGWNVGITLTYPNIVEDTINYICDIINSCEWEGCKGIMFNPGFCSVPYITTACNLMYLPSQILVGFNSFNDLKNTIKIANSKGIKCYAVAGYDGCIPNCIVAWIKFLEVPKAYLELSKKYNIEKIFTMCVYNEDGNTTGENIARLSYRKDEFDFNIQKIYEEDIYFLYINESYSSNKNSINYRDLHHFTSLINDVNNDEWINLSTTKPRRYISDWESGMDSVLTLSNDLYKHNINTYKYTLENLQGTVIVVNDSIELYHFATRLSIEFIKANNIPFKGIVFNPYFISDPSYELYYGYIPVLYWQGNPNNEMIINNLYNNHIKPFIKVDKLNLYFNYFIQQEQFNTYNFGINISTEIEKKIFNSSPLCYESGDWVSTYKPLSYNFKFIDMID